MSRIILFLISVLSICSFNIYAFTPLTVQGKVVDEKGKALTTVSIEVNGLKVKTSANGRYILALPASEVYQLTFSKNNYFSIVQTFSRYELVQKSSTIADITLVKKNDKRVMLAFAGDVMMGRRFYKPYFGDEVLIHHNNKLNDSKAIVQHIKPYMSLADYAMVNLETQIADKEPTERAPKSVTFYSQPEILSALTWAGIDYVSLGNNHTYDYMDDGLHSTLSFLQNSKLAYSGAGIDEKTALKAYSVVINNSDFSMLGYVGWEGSATPTQTANSLHGGAAYGSKYNMVQSITKQAQQNKVTIVQYHGSQEYANNPTGVTEQRLKTALDTGAAIAVAHHPHVTQGLELYNNKLIAYSMGNFIFDQNFSATQHSFMLYVWLDEGRFHRAEIVPLYVKGYKPTPATGMHRYTVMKRLSELSKQRNTAISTSGGHGVIKSHYQTLSDKTQADNKQVAIDFADDEKSVALYKLPWDKRINQVLLPEVDVAYRLGTNLINGSDFESFALFNSPERGWLFDRSATSLNNFGASGKRSLSIELKSTQASVFGMKSFRRVYKASNPMTIKAKFNVEKAVSINFYWQGRKKGQKLFDAFKHSPKHLLGSAEVAASNDWQNVEVDFNSPRIGYKSYRILAEIQSLSGEETVVNIDDFALIEWQTAFSKTPKPNFINSLSYQASYIGIDKAISLPVIIKL